LSTKIEGRRSVSSSVDAGCDVERVGRLEASRFPRRDPIRSSSSSAASRSRSASLRPPLAPLDYSAGSVCSSERLRHERQLDPADLIGASSRPAPPHLDRTRCPPRGEKSRERLTLDGHAREDERRGEHSGEVGDVHLPTWNRGKRKKGQRKLGAGRQTASWARGEEEDSR
jgi:hypothetical protein